MPPGRPRRVPDHIRPPFAWIGGAACLDFVNTASWRTPDLLENERFRSVEDLAEWGRIAGLPVGHVSAATLDAAHELRSLLYDLFTAIAEGAELHSSELARFDASIAGAARRMQPRPTTDHPAWRWVPRDPGDERVLVDAIVLAALDLVRSPDIALLRTCANERCGWLFLDRSRKHNRRWCEMRECGAQAQARRYRTRRRTQTSVEEPT